jgi:hypothetical protein
MQHVAGRVDDLACHGDRLSLSGLRRGDRIYRGHTKSRTVPVDAQNAATRDVETTKQFPQRQQRSSSVRKIPQPQHKRAEVSTLSGISHLPMSQEGHPRAAFTRATARCLAEPTSTHPATMSDEDGDDHSPSQRPYISRRNVPGIGVGCGCGCLSVGAAGGLKSAVVR